MSIINKSTLAVALTVSLGVAGCKGDAGLPGPLGGPGEEGAPGQPGHDGTNCTVTDNQDGSYTVTCDDSTITLYDGESRLSGMVTNSLTGSPIAGATIALFPAVENLTLVTDADGLYTALLPTGNYTVTITATGFGTAVSAVTLRAGAAKIVDAALVPTVAAIANIATTAATVDPGATASLSATLQAFNDATATGYTWTQVSGPTADMSATTGSNITVTLADTETLKAALWQSLEVPDRLRVVGVNPYAHEEASAAVFKVAVLASDGKTYTDEVTVHANMPMGWSLGIANVAKGVPVMLHAPTPTSSGAITAVAGSALVDGETFTIGDGVHTTVTFELDSNSAFTAGNRRIAFKSADTAITIASAIRSAINGAPNLDITANIAPLEYNAGLNIVWLTADHAGTTSDVAITETVADTGFVAAGMGGADVIAWTVTGPAAAAFDDATSRNPIFTPTAAGKYTATLAARPGIPARALDIYAGEWTGIINGKNSDGTPKSDSCDNAVCHDTTGSPSIRTRIGEITDLWRKSGHAQIFAQNLDTVPGHYSTSCLECHTVGYDTDVANGGIDDATQWPDFLDEHTDGNGGIHAAAGTWADVVANEPTVAMRANVQCESCHGPNDFAGGHGALAGTLAMNPVRFNLGSEVCGECHGEPPRHGRFQQWQTSGHGNTGLALEEATIEARSVSATSPGPGHCGRCHSGEGFLEWVKEPDLANCVGQYKTETVTGIKSCTSVSNTTKYVTYLNQIGMTNAKVHGIECAVCHDPHGQGQVSGEPNTATVRIAGNTKNLPSGFRAVAVGKGALCITCHNTRNGAKSDAIGLNPSSIATAPHTAAQGDVLMGYNAYFVPVGSRSSHADIADACANCHMEKTTPPADYSYAGGGTNHSFTAAPEICITCHGEGFGEIGLQESVEAALLDMSDLVTAQIASRINVFLAGTSFQAVTGMITVSTMPDDADTFVIADGRSNTKTFEFDTASGSGAVTSGNVRVNISSAANVNAVASAIVSAINGAYLATSTTTAPYGFTAGTSFQVTAANYVNSFSVGGVDIAVVLDYNTTGTVGTATITDSSGHLTVTPFAGTASGGGGNYTLTSAFWPDPSGAEQTIDDASLLTVAQAPAKIELEEVHGQFGVKLSFATAIPVTYVAPASGPATVTEIVVALGSVKRYVPVTGITNLPAVGPRLFDESFDSLYKSLWNLALLEADSSKGAHNPSWEYDILETTFAKLYATSACAGTAWTGANGACL